MKSERTCLESLTVFLNTWQRLPQAPTMYLRWDRSPINSVKSPLKSSPCVNRRIVFSLIFLWRCFSRLCNISFSPSVNLPSCITSNTTHCSSWQYLLHSSICALSTSSSLFKKSGVSTTLICVPNICALFSSHLLVTGVELGRDSKVESIWEFPAARIVFPDALFPVPLFPRRTMVVSVPGLGLV